MLQEERLKFLPIVWLQSKQKMKKLQNGMELVETEMMKIKDPVFLQFNTRSPSIARDGHEIPDTSRHWMLFIPSSSILPLFGMQMRDHSVFLSDFSQHFM